MGKVDFRSGGGLVGVDACWCLTNNCSFGSVQFVAGHQHCNGLVQFTSEKLRVDVQWMCYGWVVWWSLCSYVLCRRPLYERLTIQVLFLKIWQRYEGFCLSVWTVHACDLHKKGIYYEKFLYYSTFWYVPYLVLFNSVLIFHLRRLCKAELIDWQLNTQKEKKNKP